MAERCRREVECRSGPGQFGEDSFDRFAGQLRELPLPHGDERT
jgi:hypothetical protein